VRAEQAQADRRRSRASAHLPERRSGFDRRLRNARSDLARAMERTLLAYRDSTAMVATVLVTANVANVTDLVLTRRGLALGALEANPIMAMLFADNPAAAAVFKVGVGLAVTLAIWRMRRYRAVLVTSLAISATFAALMFYHALGAALWL
jgi:hypothetical protein